MIYSKNLVVDGSPSNITPSFRSFKKQVDMHGEFVEQDVWIPTVNCEIGDLTIVCKTFKVYNKNGIVITKFDGVYEIWSTHAINEQQKADQQIDTHKIEKWYSH
jgi:hypothetical protein